MLDPQKTPHSSPVRASYGVSFVTICDKNWPRYNGNALYVAIFTSCIQLAPLSPNPRSWVQHLMLLFIPWKQKLDLVTQNKFISKANPFFPLPLFTHLDCCDISVMMSVWRFPLQRELFHFLLNSLWPSDIIWRQGSRSTLAQVMDCCLTAPSHYLNQCWLIITKVQWCSSESNFAWDITAIGHWTFSLKIIFLRFYWNLPGANELTLFSDVDE